MTRNNPSNLNYESLGTTGDMIVTTEGTDGRAIQGTSILLSSGVMSGVTDIIYGGPLNGGFTGSGANIYQYGVQTTNATPNTVMSITVSSNQSIFLKVYVHGTRSDHSESIGGEIMYVARNAGAGAIEVGEPIKNVIEDSSGSPDFDINVSGTAVRIQVTGEDAKTWNWVLLITYYKVLTNS